jgi:hypothetical protein
MLLIDQSGYIWYPSINLAISHHIEKGMMTHINGIIVHQTGSATAQSTLNAYSRPGANGAHFLIDKEQRWNCSSNRIRVQTNMACWKTAITLSC